MPRRKLKATETECAAPAETKKRGRKAAPKKQVVGYKMLKRDENALVKQYASIEKAFEEITEKVNQFCYENGDKKQAATATTKTITAFMKDVRGFQKSIKTAKDSLKPIYS